MLSRVADALFWMSRYLERAEHIARLLDVAFHLELDLHGLANQPPEAETAALLTVLQVVLPDGWELNTETCRAVQDWLTFDLDNPHSILACVNRARNNARSIRGSISPEVWRELNALYWQLRDGDLVAQARESPHPYYRAVEAGSHLFQGVCDATLVHDEGWHFIQLGRYLERADKTLRILDVKVRRLRELSGPGELPLAGLQWAAVLKSCLAYEAYQRLYIGRVEPGQVAEFLLLSPGFPRSVRFCIEAAAWALARIEGRALEQPDSRAARLLGRVVADLRFGEREELLQGDLHGFLQTLARCCASVSQAIQERYHFH